MYIVVGNALRLRRSANPYDKFSNFCDLHMMLFFFPKLYAIADSDNSDSSSHETLHTFSKEKSVATKGYREKTQQDDTHRGHWGSSNHSLTDDGVDNRLRGSFSGSKRKNTGLSLNPPRVEIPSG